MSDHPRLMHNQEYRNNRPRPNKRPAFIYRGLLELHPNLANDLRDFIVNSRTTNPVILDVANQLPLNGCLSRYCENDAAFSIDIVLKMHPDLAYDLGILIMDVGSPNPALLAIGHLLLGDEGGDDN